MKTLSLLVLILFSPYVVADCKFDKTVSYTQYQIRVYTDGHSCSLQDYQVVVQRDERVLKVMTKQSEPIKQVWVTDLDRDGLFEVLVFAASVEEGQYGELALHEWTGNDFYSRFVPALNIAQQQGYRGFDNYRLYQNQLVHEFPIYQQGDKNCCPSGGKRQSIYQYRNNDIEQVASNTIN